MSANVRVTCTCCWSASWSDDEGRLAECSVCFYKSCSQPSNVKEMVLKKESQWKKMWMLVSSALSKEQMSFYLCVETFEKADSLTVCRRAFQSLGAERWLGSQTVFFMPFIYTWNLQTWLRTRMKGSCWYMAGNELLEVPQGIFEATIYHRQHFVVNTLFHTQQVKSWYKKTA